MLPSREDLDRVAVRCRLDRVDVTVSATGGQTVRVQRGAVVAVVELEASDFKGALFPDELALRAARRLAEKLDRAA